MKVSHTTHPVGKFSDRTSTQRPLTMHQAGWLFTSFGHRLKNVVISGFIGMKKLALTAALASWLFGCIGPGSNSAVTPLAPERFPELQGKSLFGDDITLPDGFEGEINLVSMGFVQGHQRDINGWIDLVPELTQSFPTLRFYEVPVIYEAGPLFRWWLNNGMRIGVVEDVARRRTITVYTDRAAFSQSINLASLDEIHTLLLDSEGRILWRQDGPPTKNGRHSLMKSIRQYLAT